GGPASVRAAAQRPVPAGLLGCGVPVLGICYGFQLMVSGLGGSVAHTGAGEYGATSLELLPPPGAAGGPETDAAGGPETDVAAGGAGAGAAPRPGGDPRARPPPPHARARSGRDTR